ARVVRRDDRIHPAAGCAVADVGLFLVAGLGQVAQFLQFFRGAYAAGALVLAPPDFEQRRRRLIRAHHGVPRAGPGEDEGRVEGFAAQGVVARAERTADDDGDLRDGRVADGVHQLGAAADDSLALGVQAD